MLALLVILAAVACQEVGLTLGKRDVLERKLGIYTLGFLNMFWGALFMIVVGMLSAEGFRFDPASLPTLALRGVLEILQAYISMRALVEAERSTLGFLQIITIPLILAVDIFLGYEIGMTQFAGIALIVFSLIVLFLNHGLGKAGVGWAVWAACNAALTVSLYKYHIDHFNSVAFEQTLFLLVLTVYYAGMAWKVERRNAFAALREKAHLVESLAMGVGMILISYSYAFASASVVTTAKRAFTVLTSIVSGNAVFKEKHLMVKLASFFLAVGGLVMLAR